MSTGISAGEHKTHVILVNPFTVTLHARDDSSEKIVLLHDVQIRLYIHFVSASF